MKISESQLKLVNDQVQRLVASGNYFGRHLQEAGVTEVLTEEDFLALPFSEKEDLRNCYPLGVSAVDEREIVRIHSSSGTTGTPVIIPYTARDVDDWAEQFKRCYEVAGITAEDRIQITPGYGLWTAGIGFQAGAEKLGAMVVPMGPGNTEKQLQFMVDLQTTVIGATSSYALLLAEEIEKRGMREQIALTKGVIGSERWGKKMRDRVKAGLGISIYDIYGLTEVYGPGIGISCDAEDGMHYWDDYIYTSILRRASRSRTGSGARSSSPRSSRRARRSSASAPTTSAASSPGRAPAAARTRASTRCRAAPTTWSRSTASTSSRARSRRSSRRSRRSRASTRSASRTSRVATPCASTSRRTAHRTSSTPPTPLPPRSSVASASRRSSRWSSSASCRAARRRPAASSTSATSSYE